MQLDSQSDSVTPTRDQLKRQIGYGTGGLAEKMKDIELVVTHKGPEDKPKEGEGNEESSGTDRG